MPFCGGLTRHMLSLDLDLNISMIVDGIMPKDHKYNQSLIVIIWK
jgi:hypothetical protein